MSLQIERCPVCNKDYPIGAWPFCDESKGWSHDTEIHGMHGFHAYVDENIADEPVLITSLAQRRRLMKQNNVDYRGRKPGMPGQEL